MSALAEVTKPAAQSTDDLDLVAAVRAGDDRAFELLFERYQARISVYVRGMVRDHGRAEDITQEVFIAALRRMRETDREIVFKPWIYEIAKNACIDAFRRTRHTSEVSLDAEDSLGASDHGRLASTGEGPDAAIDTKQSIDDLCGAFGGLSQQHHDILIMREFEGLSYREIGERLGMSRAGVESTLFRARRRLSEEYEGLVSGERCLRVRAIADAAGGRAAGLRDQRRLARHISHCQPCRRYALGAGVDVAAMRAPASIAAKIAALLPLPPFLRRRVDADQVLSAHGSTLNAMATVDPTVVSGWSKAVATAATVAVAGLSAGAAVKHEAVENFISKAPSIVGLGSGERSVPAAARRAAQIQALSQTKAQARKARAIAEERALQAGAVRQGLAPLDRAGAQDSPAPGAAQSPSTSTSTSTGSTTGGPVAGGSTGGGATGGGTSDGSSAGGILPRESLTGSIDTPPITVDPELEVVLPAVPPTDLAPEVGATQTDPLPDPANPFNTLIGDLGGATGTNANASQALPRSVVRALPAVDGLTAAEVAAIIADAAQQQQAAARGDARGLAAQPDSADKGHMGGAEPAKADAAGAPDGAGKPDDAGRPADAGKAADAGKSAEAAAPDDAGANGKGAGAKADPADPAEDPAAEAAADAGALRALAEAAVLTMAQQSAASGKPMSERAREVLVAVVIAQALRRAAAERR